VLESLAKAIDDVALATGTAEMAPEVSARCNAAHESGQDLGSTAVQHEGGGNHLDNGAAGGTGSGTGSGTGTAAQIRRTRPSHSNNSHTAAAHPAELAASLKSGTTSEIARLLLDCFGDCLLASQAAAAVAPANVPPSATTPAAARHEKTNGGKAAAATAAASGSSTPTMATADGSLGGCWQWQLHFYRTLLCRRWLFSAFVGTVWRLCWEQGATLPQRYVCHCVCGTRLYGLYRRFKCCWSICVHFYLHFHFHLPHLHLHFHLWGPPPRSPGVASEFHLHFHLQFSLHFHVHFCLRFTSIFTSIVTSISRPFFISW
jgi:cell division septation protein DedD